MKKLERKATKRWSTEKEGMRLNILVVVLIVGWLSETESVVDVDTVDENFLVESLKRLKVRTLRSRDRRRKRDR